MKDEDKTKEQLIIELKQLRQRITEFERSETELKRAELVKGRLDIQSQRGEGTRVTAYLPLSLKEKIWGTLLNLLNNCGRENY